MNCGESPRILGEGEQQVRGTACSLFGLLFGYHATRDMKAKDNQPRYSLLGSVYHEQYIILPCPSVKQSSGG